MIKFFSKKAIPSHDGKNKTYTSKKEVLPRQQEDVTGAISLAKFKYKKDLNKNMKRGCLAFFVFLIALFLACGSIADKNKDYKTIITKEQTVSAETSAVLNNGKVLEGSSQSTEEDKEELKEQLRSLGYLS